VLEDEVNQDFQNPMKVLWYAKTNQQGKKKKKFQSPRVNLKVYQPSHQSLASYLT